MPDMPDMPDVASVAALVGDPTRARMLTVLMGGRALTATELALEGGVMPPTASSHLARLAAAGLVTIARQGRHRYFRIATPEVATSIEQLMGLAERAGLRTANSGPRDAGLRRARVCYDHLAGETGVRLLDRMREANVISGRVAGTRTLILSPRGESFVERLEIVR